MSSFGTYPADVLLNFFDPFDRQIELVVTGILQMQEIPFQCAGDQMGQAEIATDAVIRVDNEVPFLELRQAGQQVAGPLPAFNFPAMAAPTENIFFADDIEPVLRQAEAVVQGSDGQGRLSGRDGIESQPRGNVQLDVACCQQLGQAFGLTFPVADQQGLPAVCRTLLQSFEQRFETVPGIAGPDSQVAVAAAGKMESFALISHFHHLQSRKFDSGRIVQ